MNTRYTPIGFLPGDVELRTHCMFTYGRKDDTFVRSVVEFLAAGVNARELCVCVLDGPTRERVRDRMTQLGVDSDPRGWSSQLVILGMSDIYLSDGLFDTHHALKFWREMLDVASNRWNGLRTFVDAGAIHLDRPARLKLLEYEAMLNVNFSANIATCAFQTDNTPRSFFLSAKKLHPYIANSRSLRKNHNYIPSDRFFTSFYRYSCIPRVYSWTSSQLPVIQEDLENVAVRTPLNTNDIHDLKESIAVVFHELAGCREKSMPSRLHVTFDSKPGRFTVVLRCYNSVPDLSEISSSIMTCSVDEVHVSPDSHAPAVTLVKHTCPRPWGDLTPDKND
ncbi:MAG: MEDS domain-containing protein [Armatimonadetes bacterium]|nr:MEDS domain-containing protein [Armatimonadota bacterium]